MGKVKTIARRSFLIGSAAIVGGVAFGTYLAKRAIPNPLLQGLAEGEAAITPYVKIDATGITLITPRADKGQGAYSIQASLIAEELDIDPATATITPGLPDPAYFNGTVLAESVPFPAYDQGKIAETMRDFMSVPAKLLEVQITGGSSTVPDGYVTLRMAGAVARETLKEAAARQMGVSRDQLSTKDGHVILPDGRKIPYSDLAPAASKLDPITDIDLRDPKEWRILGKADTKRLDMVAKCTGTETYGLDLQVEGMVHATVRSNPSVGGEMVGFDATEAQSMRGVSKIVPVSGGVGVIADNTWRAIQAVNAIEFEWGPAPFPESSEQMFDILEAAVGEDDKYDHRQRDEGNVDDAVTRGEIIEASYRIPYLAHAPLEPMNAIVRVTDDACEIWTGTQIPLFVRNKAAALTGLKPEQVFVYGHPMGGSFGHRLEMTHVEQTFELAMAVKGTPVKMTWSREEDMAHEYPRPAAVAKARGKVLDGKVDTFDMSVAQSAIVSGWFDRLMGRPVPGPDATITTGSWDQPFDIPNYRVTGYRAPDMVPVTSWRSVGASGNGFFHDCFLDELIHAAGADPLAERIRLCLHDTSRKVLEAVGEMSDWNGPSLGPNRGRGVSFCMSFGVPVAQVIEVTNTEDGIKVDKLYCAVDSGPVLDPTNFEAQVSGGALFGLGHAMSSELTYADHATEQTNFDGYEALRLYQTPSVEVKALSNAQKIRGIGEPAVPPAAPALANAIFAATGQRIRELPLSKHIDFV
ncbi:molybdopterin cofactor-binding domain-containing protein [uncultured Litoreibacter sp.]|uniref:xanthine dehydrogenase family protein molybdopterin-binding subunit n=1 Tax=uncultured Litoreibacter sp. TaxID=1392394 RepID=UPI0026142BCF|nr:molybdopterin cofactor-binding domain-containing protein [uncultured Litoreibacter sp.]